MNLSFLEFPREIALVEKLVMSAECIEGNLAREVAAYIDLGGGKKLRPRILILTARELGYDRAAEGLDESDPVVQAAAALELVHTASLIHDDMVDHSSERRGRPSVHAKFGRDVAILMADMLYARAFDLALKSTGAETTRRLCAITRSMCESELFQIEKRGAMLSEADYYSIIDRKTAGLFSLCTEIGARLAGADKPTVEKAAALGRALGMVYQITDDVLDYTASDAAWGKPLGGDVAEGKQTLPLVATWQRADSEDRTKIEALLANGRDLEKVLEIIKRYNGIDYAESKAREYQAEAVQLACSITTKERAAHFKQITKAIVERTY